MTNDEDKSKEQLIVELQAARRQIAAFSSNKRVNVEDLTHPQFSEFFDASPDPTSFLDQNYVYQAVNTAYERYFNKSRQDIVGSNAAEIFKQALFHSTVKPNLDRCLKGENVHYEIWIEFPRLGWRYMSVAYNPRRNNQGEIIGILHISRDITEHKKHDLQVYAELEKLSGILSSLKTGLSLINSDMTIDWVNEYIRSIFPQTEPEGKICYEFFEDRSTPCPDCGAIKAFEQGKPHQLERYHHEKGRWFSIFVEPLHNASGNVVQVLEGITDITESKLAEQAL